MADDFTGIIVPLFLFLAISVSFTYFVKKRFNAQVFAHLFSLVRTTKPLWIFDKLAKHKRFFTTLADIGLVLGFGAIAVDYMFLRGKKSFPVRLVAFVVSSLIMAGLFIFIDSIFGGPFSEGYMTRPIFPLMAAVFGIAGLSGFIFSTLIINAYEIIYRYMIGERACPGVAPLLPGIEIPRVPFTIPAYAWIHLFVILIIHEGAHGVLGRIAKVPFKSTGVMLFGFLPIGAFVEPDDAEVEKKTSREKLRFFAAGISSNLAAFAIGAIALLLFALSVQFFFGAWAQEVRTNSVSGVQVKDVFERVELCGSFFESTAFGKLEIGSRILQANGVTVKSSTDLLVAIAQKRFQALALTVEKNGLQKELLLEPNELGTYGFMVEDLPNPDYVVPQSFKDFSFYAGLAGQVILWFALLNFLIALVNVLPFPVFDGGRIAPILFAPYAGILAKDEKKRVKRIQSLFLVIILALFLINFLPVII
ncbi:MAG: site-2 protease family protein [archaeon]|nr:site-2 protease family protein [archaeon]